MSCSPQRRQRDLSGWPRAPSAGGGSNLRAVKSPLSTDEKQTPLADITSYNNYYEFGTDKDDPAANAHTLKTRPWTVKVEGWSPSRPSYHARGHPEAGPLEERIYRMRCVEGWSMVIPWVGFPLADLLKRVEPTGSAKYVAFETLVRPEQMPGQRGFPRWTGRTSRACAWTRRCTR